MHRGFLLSAAAVSLLGSLAMSHVALAADWPQFKRDAARTGDAADESLKLPMRRVMALRLPSPIYASPAVVGGMVYVGDARGNVICAEAATGRVKWHAKIGGLKNTSSPAVAGGRVFIGSSAGYLAILDAADGRLLKKVEAGDAVIASPAAVGEKIYFSAMNGELFKIDPQGGVVWKCRPGKARISLVEVAVRGDQILFPAGTLYHLKDEGKSARQLGVRGFKGRITSGPCFGTAEHFAAQGFVSEWGHRVIVNLAGGRGLATKQMVDSRGVPSFRKDRYFWGGLCYEVPGEKIRGRARPAWRADSDTLYPGSTHSSPALSSRYMILGSEDGRVHFLALEGEEKVRKPAWTFTTVNAGGPNSAVSSSPAISGGKVFFGGEDGILYGLGSGAEVAVKNALPDAAYKPREFPGAKLKGHEWHMTGGDKGFSCVSPETKMKPPLKLKWRTRMWSSTKGPIIVAEGRAFRAGRLGELEALDAATGEVIWRAHHLDAESRPSPTYADGKLLVMRGAVSGIAAGGRINDVPQRGGGIYCHDAGTGKLVWHKRFKFGYHYNSDGLLVHDGKAIACWNGGGGSVEVAALKLADGSAAWHRSFKGLIAADRKDLFRFTAVYGDGRIYLSVPPARGAGKGSAPGGGATLALKPESGEIIWKNTKQTILGRSRIAFRKGTLVVFAGNDSKALDPKTGELLWTGVGGDRGKGCYMNPLTDLYLDSRGRKGIPESWYCSYSVFVNGFWYGHEGRDMAARTISSGAKGTRDVTNVVWKQSFTCHACPTPTPAYGRLYYSPNAEGVVYCYEPEGRGK